MLVVVGEDDCLSYCLSAVYPLSMFHQVLQDKINSLLVKDIGKDLVCFNVMRHRRRGILRVIKSCLILPHLFELVLLLLTKAVVFDATRQQERSLLNSIILDKVSVFYGLLQFIGEIRLVVQSQQLIGRTLDFISRCGSETDQKGIKVVEDSTILAKNRTMGFINDCYVKITYTEKLVLVLNSLNHRLVGRENDSSPFKTARIAIFSLLP